MMGRVVKDPDLRYTQTENGELAIANFRLAVDRKFVRLLAEKQSSRKNICLRGSRFW